MILSFIKKSLFLYFFEMSAFGLELKTVPIYDISKKDIERLYMYIFIYFGNLSLYILTIWTYGTDTLESFLDYPNQIDSTGKIKFTMQVQDEDGIEFMTLNSNLK